MPKDIPECPPKPTPKAAAVRHYEIELVTPMFGGGVEPRANDPTFPIRATAIRGQLQFWWRATAWRGYETVKELRKAQTEVWGSTERASRVQLRVDELKMDSPLPCASIEWDPSARTNRGGWRINWKKPFGGRNSSLPYALFPFQGETPRPVKEAPITVPPAACIHRLSFRLTLHCPDKWWETVEQAIWAWVNFGGLGSRTRRGCGTIHCEELAPKNRDDILRLCKPLVSNTDALREWPTLAAAIHVGGEQTNPISAWDDVIDRFKNFRQGVDLGRNQGQQRNRPGRSRFPEPETIRRVTQKRLGRHGRIAQIPDDAFPRAEFGLPIVFHFQEEGDPPDTVLYPSVGPNDTKRERMASPLILKPLKLQNGKAVPLILRLRTPDLMGVDLRQGDTSRELPPTTVIRDPRLSSYPNSPLAWSASGSAIEAFLAFCSDKQGFTEVTP